MVVPAAASLVFQKEGIVAAIFPASPIQSRDDCASWLFQQRVVYRSASGEARELRSSLEGGFIYTAVYRQLRAYTSRGCDISPYKAAHRSIQINEINIM